MRDNITVQLNSKQREYLLAGLRFVRNSVAQEIQEWSEDVENRRQRQYGDIDGLAAMLSGVPASEARAVV